MTGDNLKVPELSARVAPLSGGTGNSDHRGGQASQLQDNLASFERELSTGQLKSLDEASRIELGFPYDLYNKEMLRAFAYGGLRDRLLL